MALSYCKGCGASYTGLRCPACHRPIPAVGCLTILLPMIVGLSLLASVIPNEVVPRRSVEENGNIIYVFQSLQEAVFWPVGAVLFLLVSAIYGVLFREKPQPGKPRTARTASGKGIQRLIRLCFLLAIGFLFSIVIFIIPLTQFRRIEISGETVVCSSLFRTRAIPIGDISAIRVEREQITQKRKEFQDSRIVIQTRSKMFPSVEIRLGLEDADLPRFTNMMDMCVADIRDRIR